VKELKKRVLKLREGIRSSLVAQGRSRKGFGRGGDEPRTLIEKKGNIDLPKE